MTLGPFNVVDVALMLIAVLAAFGGWRQGFIGSALAFIGFCAGAVVGVLFTPVVLERVGISGWLGVGATVVVALTLAALGNAVFGDVGHGLHGRLPFRALRGLDRGGGLAFSVLSLALVAWLVASVVVALPDGALVRQVRASRVLTAIDDAIPTPARGWVAGLGQALDDSGLPRVFAGLGVEPIVPVEPPDASVLADPAVRAAADSLVRIEGRAPECGIVVDGSGFVYSRGRIMTNAHVVAGTTDLEVRIRGVGRAVPATVVYLDARTDVAVLSVPDLGVRSLSFADGADRGTSAVVAGFPGGGSLQSTPARIRATINARGSDIYGQAGVMREVYSIRGRVRPGNSGGPLLSTAGAVYGMVFAASVDDPDTGYALTAAQVGDAAEAGRQLTAAVATGSCRTR